ncbi:putative secreted protein (Por secretion system target) [Lutibacter oceani]|uniref:Putative secreted protein (Por secretion system target) n=1 Tax=Lutibacter oceani TaxID=1853311 RepID=A0A3D9RUQ7_9FLAO|nr:lamin tail domain-containing protein [Lutibacter oceani]REE83577.1 putative secreted protein (Por secretion system target) [Lutibacter oceani]
MKKIYLLVVTTFVVTLSFGQTDVFINEIHYDNSGADIDEGIEIAGPSGTDLSGWSLLFYNGVDGTIYDTKALSGLIPNLQNNRGTVWFLNANIQNDIEGIALLDPNNFIVQFLSYKGAFTATSGLATGMTSVDIGVFEDGTDPAGESLQLTGSGTNYEDFSWALSAIATNGLVNNGQTFILAPSILASNSVSGMNYEFNFGPSAEGTFNVSGTNLTTNNIVLIAPTNFEISETSGSGWVSSINLSPIDGTVPITTIYVRLKANLNIGYYTDNLVINSLGAISKTVVLSGNVSPNVGSIIITEIMHNPTMVTDANGEYFEVYNTTAIDIDLNGWVISDNESESHPINSSVIVPSGGFAVLARNSIFVENGNFNADYDFVSFTLSSIDEIILTTPVEMGSVIIDQVYYNDIDFPNYSGESMELHLYKYNSVSNDTGSNWGTATTAYGLGDLGTPGANNDFGLAVVKNEIENFSMYPNPVSNGVLYISSNNNLNKQVEIYNLTGQQVYNTKLELKKIINISDLNRGIYFVRVEEGGKIATRKLIVN